jgi:hypothetical protein
MIYDFNTLGVFWTEHRGILSYEKNKGSDDKLIEEVERGASLKLRKKAVYFYSPNSDLSWNDETV